MVKPPGFSVCSSWDSSRFLPVDSGALAPLSPLKGTTNNLRLFMTPPQPSVHSSLCMKERGIQWEAGLGPGEAAGLVGGAKRDQLLLSLQKPTKGAASPWVLL